jgi:hypothetical protein
MKKYHNSLTCHGDDIDLGNQSVFDNINKRYTKKVHRLNILIEF